MSDYEDMQAERELRRRAEKAWVRCMKASSIERGIHAAALAAKDERIEELERAARGGNATNDTATMLRWLADRLVTTHVERRQAEIIRCAYERAAMLDAALQPAAREGGE